MAQVNTGSPLIDWQGVQGLMATMVSSQTGILTEILLDLIDPNPHQARQDFDERSIAELADSLRRHSLIQPITVRAVDGRYQLIAGERRWRAAKVAEMETISSIVKEGVGDRDAAIQSLVENLQREDLSPADVCRGLKMLKEMTGLGWETIGEMVGLSRRSVHRYLELDKMPEEVRTEIDKGHLSMTQAKALSSAPAEYQGELLTQTLAQGLSAPQVGELAQELETKPEVSPATLAREVQETRRGGGRRENRETAFGEVTEAHRRILTSLEDEGKRRGVEENIVAYSLDLIDTRRLVMFLLESEGTPVPSAVAMVRQLRGKKLGEVLTRIEVALEIMGSTSFLELTGSERKMAEVILKWLHQWVANLQEQLRQSWVVSATATRK